MSHIKDPISLPSDNPLTRLKQWDEARADFPGEHWIVLAAGLGVWYLSARHPSAMVKLAGMAAATALVGRAASGRNGLSKLLRYTPVGGALRGR
ncbi:MAG: hypothetical protein V4757_02810 [Pseudomonadota bacterium]